MRTLEILLELVLIIRIILPLFRRGRWIEWGSLAVLSVMALHLIFEGYRWQMIPLYGITLWLSAIAFWRLSRPESQTTNLSSKRFAATIL